MTFKKKEVPAEAPATAPEWKYEDGVDANTPPDIRARWLAEYKSRLWAALPKAEVKDPIWKST